MNQTIRKVFAGATVSFFSGLATAAAVAAANANIPDFPAVDKTTAGILGGGVIAVVVAALQLRKMLSNSSLDVKSNTSAAEMLDRTTKERDQFMAEAREAWRSKNADSLEIGQLRAENAFLRDQVKVTTDALAEIRRGVQHVGRNVDRVKDQMDATEKRISNTGPAPLGEL